MIIFPCAIQYIPVACLFLYICTSQSMPHPVSPHFSSPVRDLSQKSEPVLILTRPPVHPQDLLLSLVKNSLPPLSPSLPGSEWHLLPPH